ncbi:unnamed protein product [Phytophthora fragariaefolia]|uniref:Unnamed protein product n=1 Tax=Phytophthora fragariaefolia TaxID=1490495 RepID=A0A9W6YGQ3_9STRA|nr:unnamed protein product [Phytophthora fragariaefolia]
MDMVRGPCTYERCEALQDEELVADPCTVCRKPVHHFCSNSLLDGGLDVCVCSIPCRNQLQHASSSVIASNDHQHRSAVSTLQSKKRKQRSANPKRQSNATTQPRSRIGRPRGSASAESMVPLETTHFASTAMPENLSSNGVAGRLAKPPDGGLLRQHTDESGAQDRSTLGSAHHGIVRKRRVHEHDGDPLQQILDEVDSDDERVAHGAKVIAQVASNVEESDVDISTKRAPANLPVTSHQEPSSTAKLHRKKKKSFLYARS